jgi:uncharacterized protein YebE (UPF0316 family)
MERQSGSTIILGLAIVILIAWGLAFSLKDHGIGCIVAVFAVVVTVIGLKEVIDTLNKKSDSIHQ